MARNVGTPGGRLSQAVPKNKHAQRRKVRVIVWVPVVRQDGRIATNK